MIDISVQSCKNVVYLTRLWQESALSYIHKSTSSLVVKIHILADIHGQVIINLIIIVLLQLIRLVQLRH